VHLTVEETSGSFPTGGLPLQVSALEWLVTLCLTSAILGFDVVVIARRPHEPTVSRCALALSGYVGLAAFFGGWIWWCHGQQFGLQFFAGWLTEYSLSIDNLFMFIVIMANFNVPKLYQLRALFFGVVIALILRGALIALGTAAIQRFSWVFYVFGAFLLFTAVRLARSTGHGQGGSSAVARFARNHSGTVDNWDGMKLYAREGSKRVLTPIAVVVLALGATDLVFALDSIPAIYGLTSQAYLVFAANVFALMGMRQLYFLVGGLLSRLVYLSKGLAAVLFFIGAKLVLHALRENSLPFVNGGAPVQVPEISTMLSLSVIVVTLVATAIASLYATRDQHAAAH
jgi:tellurite resistance protein TerC